jgi:hypothetical protein
VIRNARAMKAAGHLLGVRFFRDSSVVPCTITAEPHVIHISSPEGTARLYLRTDDGVAINSEGLDFELKMLQAGLAFPAGGGRFNFQVGGVYVPIAPVTGTPTLRFDRYIHEDGIQRITHASLKIACANGKAMVHFALQPQEKPLNPLVDPDAEIREVENQWLNFRSKMPRVPEDRTPIAELAWYTLWSAFVRPEGYIKYDACLMSKATMSALWSWDHCFNALAIAHADPVLGLQQFLLPFELQAENGQLPSQWSNLERRWATKPPIHGWCLTKLLRHFPGNSGQNTLAPDLLRKLHAYLEKWTGFWLSHRDTDADGISNYIWGNDSGWDNSTLFDPGICPETPDLPAYLALQMDALAELSSMLGDAKASSEWTARADALIDKLLRHSWKNDRFVAPVSMSHAFDPAPTSLLALMPLALGKRLDPAKYSLLVQILERDFLTPHGPATESPSSPLYLPEGYWRGPIWAPSTYLIVDGLTRAGYHTLAKDIARRFCNMVRDAGGHYENYNAITGKGLCDQGYTWTASVHILLLNEYLLS